MVNPVLEQELHEQLDQLAAGQQQRVLEFARNLAGARVRGLPGRNLLRFADTISHDDLEQMSAAIEAGCEQACG